MFDKKNTRWNGYFWERTERAWTLHPAPFL
jgi:hypothetical protein